MVRAEDVVSTGVHTSHEIPSSNNDTSSDADNCDVLSDRNHLDESHRPRF